MPSLPKRASPLTTLISTLEESSQLYPIDLVWQFSDYTDGSRFARVKVQRPTPHGQDEQIASERFKLRPNVSHRCPLTTIRREALTQKDDKTTRPRSVDQLLSWISRAKHGRLRGYNDFGAETNESPLIDVLDILQTNWPVLTGGKSMKW